MGAPTIVNTKIGPGKLIQTDPESQAITRLDIGIVRGPRLVKGLGIGKDYPSKKPARRNTETVLRFKIQHVLAPVTPLDITPGGIAVSVPSGAGQQQIGRTAAPDGEPVITPDGQDVVGGGREIDVFAQVEDQGLPVLVAAQKGEIGPVGDAGVVAFFGVDGISSAIKKKVQADA